jgi:cell division protein FtsL
VTALSRLTLLLFCGLVLAAGFVLAAKQHFAAVQYGYQNETLRSERKKLIEDYQRLALEKEKALSPARLEMAARALGMKPATAGQIQTLQPKAPIDLEARSTNASRKDDRSSGR